MRGLLNSARAGLVVWWLTIAWALLFTVSSLVSSFLVAVIHIDFPSLPRWEKFMIFLGVFLNWAQTMMAFLSKASAKISAGELPASDTTPTPNTP